MKGVQVQVDDSLAVSSVAAGADREALDRRLADARAELQRAQAKLANQRFVSGAPEQVVAAERDKAERYAAEVAELERRLSEQ